MHTADSVVLTEVTVRSDDGGLLAQGTSRSWTFPFLDPVPPPPESPYTMQDVQLGLEPHRLDICGAGLDSTALGDRTGAEYLDRYAAGAYEQLPLYHLLGIRPVSRPTGGYGFGIAGDPWLCSPLGNVQGGVIAFLAERAAWASVTQVLPRGASCRTQDIKVSYFRPIAALHQQIVATGDIVWRGRNFAVVRVQVGAADAEPAAIATATVRLTGAS